MLLEDKKIKETLLAGGYVTKENLDKAEEFSKTRHVSILDYLLTESLITKDLLGQAIAESYKIPYADLNSTQPPREQVLKIPESFAKKHRVVLFKEEPKRVVVTTDNPEETKLVSELKNLFKDKKILITYSLSEDIDQIFIHYRKALEARFVKIIKEQKRVAPEIIEEIMEDALLQRASDIHFEPQEKDVVVRFRIDGVLHEMGQLPKEQYENILNRIKVQTHMRIDEHLAAQDGAMRYVRNGNPIDLRVSIVPVLEGERVSIRILAEYVRKFTLGDLGLSPTHQNLVLQAAKKPFGMIIVTGPTGSGKTTTLYALIKFLNQPEINITTIEDPVEYKVIGVNQIQVNPQTNLTFAKGLRSILRQDPNIILVGEIRDKETAEISVNAALTGHLLLSTFHANDAATAIPRLLDMGVEPFLLASTLEVLVAQRLVRRICESCRHSDTFEQKDLEKTLPEATTYFPEKKITLYKGKGCAVCGHTGYHGRIGIFEFIEVTPEMKDLILKNPSTREIWKLARTQGSKSLFEDGIDKVKTGITTMEELLRVASPPKE